MRKKDKLKGEYKVAVEGVSDFLTNNAIKESVTKNKNELSMDDFFQLMIAQLKNQDMFSPTDNSQFMAQMAQFSMVNALTDMSELSSVAYSTSLIGKLAEVAYITGGKMGTTSGIIEAVNLYNGNAQVVIGGEPYELSNIMTVNDPGKSGTQNYTNLPLIENSGLIGMTATLFHTAETGNIETVTGKITGLKMVDDQLFCVIDSRAYNVKEITTLSDGKADVQVKPAEELAKEDEQTQAAGQSAGVDGAGQNAETAGNGQQEAGQAESVAGAGQAQTGSSGEGLIGPNGTEDATSGAGDALRGDGDV